MANNKQILMDYPTTALTVYCVVRREADDYLLDDADGNFTDAPADYFILMPESQTTEGRYELDESRQVWDNGLYTVCIYKQEGASPIPAADTMIGDGELVIQDDVEISNFLSSIPWSGTTTVIEIVNQILPRLAGTKPAGFSALDGINAITNEIFKRLWKRKSDIVAAEIAILYAAGNPAMSVPPSFFGIRTRPYIPGAGELDKLDPADRQAYYGMTGPPQVYDLRGNTLYVYPTPQENTVIKLGYFRNPGKVDSLDDVVPFTGMFNQVYIEALINYSAKGTAYLTDQPFAAFVDGEIEAILPVRNAPLRGRRLTSYF